MLLETHSRSALVYWNDAQELQHAPRQKAFHLRKRMRQMVEILRDIDPYFPFSFLIFAMQGAWQV